MSPFQDNFVAGDFIQISSDIQQSFLSNTNIVLSPKESAWLRSAISRAYYSAFLQLRHEFRNDPTLQSRVTPMSNAHSNIKNELINNLPAHLIYLANDFDNLRVERNHADYDLPGIYDVNPSKVRTSSISANRIISNIGLIMSNL